MSNHTTGSAPAVEAVGLTKTFDRRSGGGDAVVRAVDGINLTITPGEIVGFLGPNGAGKTTTLDMVLGLTEPSTGTVTVFGDAPRRAVHAGQVSAVLQTGGLLRDLTVRETVQLIASTYPTHAPVDDVVARAGLTSLAGRRVSKCSGGEQQRLRFALSLLPDPRLLVLDEPTAGMDVNARRDFWDTMRADTTSGRTVIFATHYLEEADAFADRIVLLAGGRIVADGPTAEIRSRASGRTVEATVNGGRAPEVAQRLRQHDAVVDVVERAGRLSVLTTDSDDVARLLLTELDGSDLEISTASLEQAFVALTGEHPANDPGQPSGIPVGDESDHTAKDPAR